MEYVQTILETLNFSKIEQRTYFKFICNIEMTIRMAMGLKTMSRSFRLTGKQPYSFLQQLRNWAANKLLEMDYQDFQMLEKIAPYILYIVNHTGTCHEDIAMQFMEGFIRKVESRMLSDVALREISAEEARRKPMARKDIVCQTCGFIRQLPKGVYFHDISTPGSWTCHQACWDSNTKCWKE